MEFVPVHFLSRRIDVERRADGALVLRSPETLGAYARCLGEHLARWARERPGQVFLAQRRGEAWETLTYAETLRRVRALATALLRRELSAQRPIAILSENSLAHGLMTLAAMHAGIPVVPISAAYSLMSRDFKKLRSIFSLMTPGLVLVDEGHRYAAAVAALGEHAFELVVEREAEALPRPATSYASLLEETDEAAVARAFAAIAPDTIAKFLLTSGSTGEPKAVVTTQRMLCSNQQAHAQTWPFLAETPPVIVDWLPWNHAMAGNNNFGTALTHGGSYYIDEGRPVPGLIEATARNLREIAPTVYYNVPRGYEALLPFLERDRELRRNFFSRLQVMLFGGAALPASIWERLHGVAEAELGRRVHITSGYGATETAPGVTLVHFEAARPSVLGLPIPGVDLKMAPVAGDKYEVRVRGDNVTPGYWKRPDLTAAAFDDEGFYRMGDAARLVDADEPAQGIEFAGRVAEEFKLTSGTWVQVGVLRTRAITLLSPIAQDIVIAGHDRDEIGFLIFPSLAGCRTLCPDLPAAAPLAALLADARVRDGLRLRLQALKAEGGGSSTYATRALLLDEPPQIDAGEITDKGYLNQRAVLERRADAVERLYREPVSPEVVTLMSA